MKYIKQYESLKIKSWRISTDQPFLKQAFRKIGMTTKKALEWCVMFKNWKKQDIFIFNDNNSWSWSSVDAKDYDGIKYNHHPDIEYMGKIELDEHEANLIETEDKYNL